MFDLTPSSSSGTLSPLLFWTPSLSSSSPSPELSMFKSTLIHSMSFRPSRDRLLVATISAKVNKLFCFLVLFYSRINVDFPTNANYYVRRLSPVSSSQPVLFFLLMGLSTQTRNKCKWFVHSLIELFTTVTVSKLTRHCKQKSAAGKN